MYFKIILIALVAYVLLLIAYPETRLWLKELIKKFPFLSGSLTCLVLVIITFLYFPPLFKSIAIEFWGIPTTVFQDGSVEVTELADLGPIGDIFGSLNSFISSIALCAVAYSTILQIKELRLSRQTYKDQLSETKFSNFSNLFYSLLNHKQAQVNNLMITNQGVTYDSYKIFIELTKELSNLCKNKWNNIDEIKEEMVRQELVEFASKTFGNYFHAQIHSYFLVYSDLLNLINRADISKENKDFFKRVLSNTMSGPEQISLLWVSSYRNDLSESLNDSQIFRLFYSDNLLPFAKKFHDKSHFSNTNFLENWDSIEQTKKTLA